MGTPHTRAHPPELAKVAKWKTLALVPGSFVDEELKDSHSDLLFSVEMRSRYTLLYVLFEHQSTVDPWMPLRLLEYMLRIWRAHLTDNPKARRLPPIVPIVLHHSEHGWTAGTSFEGLFEMDDAVATELMPFVPRFRFVLDDVSRATDDELRARAVTALAKLVLGCLRHARQMPEMLGDPDRWETTLREVADAPHGVHALGIVPRHVFHVSDGCLDVGQVRRFFRGTGEPAITWDRRRAVSDRLALPAFQRLEKIRCAFRAALRRARRLFRVSPPLPVRRLGVGARWDPKMAAEVAFDFGLYRPSDRCDRASPPGGLAPHAGKFARSRGRNCQARPRVSGVSFKVCSKSSPPKSAPR